jgi:hypothetical protein
MTNSQIISSIDQLIEEVTKLTIAQKLVKAARLANGKKRFGKKNKGMHRFGKSPSSGVVGAAKYLFNTTKRGAKSNYRDAKYALGSTGGLVSLALATGHGTIKTAKEAVEPLIKGAQTVTSAANKVFQGDHEGRIHLGKNIKDAVTGTAHDTYKFLKDGGLKKLATADNIAIKPQLHHIPGTAPADSFMTLHPFHQQVPHSLSAAIAMHLLPNISNRLRHHRLIAAETSRLQKKFIDERNQIDKTHLPGTDAHKKAVDEHNKSREERWDHFVKGPRMPEPKTKPEETKSEEKPEAEAKAKKPFFTPSTVDKHQEKMDKTDPKKKKNIIIVATDDYIKQQNKTPD